MQNIFKLSKFILPVDLFDDKMTMFNTRTGSLCFLDKSIYYKLYNNDLEFIDKLTLSNLNQNKIIVPIDKDEALEYICDTSNQKELNDSISITIAPSYICNFDCNYCFVRKNQNIMNLEVANRIVNFLYNKYSINNNIRINITWFGGEPLLQIPFISNFMKKVFENIPKENIASRIITNGYLLSIETVKTLIDLNIKAIQITLDGDEKTHNKYRNHKDGSSTYSVIVDNIVQLLNSDLDFTLNLRVNFFNNEEFNVNNLLDYLNQHSKVDHRVHIQFKPIINFNGGEHNDEGFAIYGDIEKYKIQLEKKVCSDNNKKVVLPVPRLRWCSAGLNSTLNIGPLGELYFCKSQYGNYEKVIGYITKESGIEYTELYYKYVKFSNEMIDEKCKECFALPLCMGGCKIRRMQNNGDYCYWNKENVSDSVKIWLQTHGYLIEDN